MLDKVIEIGLLFDFYGKLLTNKQQEIIVLYYYDDLSLGEIAERLKISRQGVYDHLQRGEEQLKEYENTLQLIKHYKKIKNQINQLEDYIMIVEIKPEIQVKIKEKINLIKDEI